MHNWLGLMFICVCCLVPLEGETYIAEAWTTYHTWQAAEHLSKGTVSWDWDTWQVAEHLSKETVSWDWDTWPPAGHLSKETVSWDWDSLQAAGNLSKGTVSWDWASLQMGLDSKSCRLRLKSNFPWNVSYLLHTFQSWARAIYSSSPRHKRT